MNAAFAWPGGKRALLPTLLKLIPKHTTYVEVFAGSAKLLFAKEPSRYEVLNDLNGDVINFYRVAKHRTAELAERFESECIHAGRFRDLRAATPECEIDRALRFVYLTWYSFSAMGEHFASGTGKTLRPPRSLAAVRKTFTDVSERLARVLIEQRDFIDILQRYDSPQVAFYLDPPYVDFESNGRYGPLEPAQREELFKTLSRLKGRFLLSFDAHPEIIERAKRHRFHVRHVEVNYCLGGNNTKRAGEVLIANYPLAA